jgi:hypothetical protein
MCVEGKIIKKVWIIKKNGIFREVQSCVDYPLK